MRPHRGEEAGGRAADVTGTDGTQIAPSLGSLDRILGFHLSRAHLAIVQDFKRSVDAFQLTPKQSAVMWLTDETPGISPIEVARLLGIDRATVFGIINALGKRGWIERGLRRDPSARPDRRIGGRLGLHLTTSGSGTLRRTKVAIEEHEQRFQQKLSPEETRTLFMILKKLSA